jgi:hypothetical protein
MSPPKTEDIARPRRIAIVPGKTGWLEHSLARCPGVVAPDALQFSTKTGPVKGIEHHLDRGEVEVVAAYGQIVTLAH